MKTILRIFDILLIASVVAIAFSLGVSNISVASRPSGGDQPVGVVNTGVQPVERPDGSFTGGSVTGGLLQVLATIAKLTVITILVLLIQKIFSLLGNRRLLAIRR